MKNAAFLHGMTVVGERGQIVIPHAIRDAMKIKAGEEMVVIAREGKIIVMPAKKMEEMYNLLLGDLNVLRKNKSKNTRSSKK